MRSGRREGRGEGVVPDKESSCNICWDCDVQRQRQHSSLFGGFKADQHKVCELHWLGTSPPSIVSCLPDAMHVTLSFLLHLCILQVIKAGGGSNLEKRLLVQAVCTCQPHSKLLLLLFFLPVASIWKLIGQCLPSSRQSLGSIVKGVSLKTSWNKRC